MNTPWNLFEVWKKECIVSMITIGEDHELNTIRWTFQLMYIWGNKIVQNCFPFNSCLLAQRIRNNSNFQIACRKRVGEINNIIHVKWRTCKLTHFCNWSTAIPIFHSYAMKDKQLYSNDKLQKASKLTDNPFQMTHVIQWLCIFHPMISPQHPIASTYGQ